MADKAVLGRVEEVSDFTCREMTGNRWEPCSVVHSSDERKR